MEYKSLFVGYMLGCSSLLLVQQIRKREWRLFKKNKKNETTYTQTLEFKWSIYGYLYRYPDNVHIVERSIMENGKAQFRAIGTENEYIDLTNLINNEIENDNIITFDNGEEYIFTKSLPHIEPINGC